MISDKEFLETELKMGISNDNPLFVALCDNTALQLKDYPIKSVLDFGAGTGIYSNAYYKLGYEVNVYEIWDAHKEYIAYNFPYLKIIDEPITTDLMNFIEVAEHMTDKELNALFKKIKPTYILFSSTSQTTENDEMWGHINIKSQDEWIKFFDKKGYKLEKELSLPTLYTKLFKLCQ